MPAYGSVLEIAMHSAAKGIAAILTSVEAAPAGYISAAVALALLILHRSNMRVSTSVSLLKQIQDLNLIVAKGDKDFIAALRRGDLHGHSEPWIKELYWLFYQINIVHDTWIARRSLLISSQHTLLSIREILRMLAMRYPDQLIYLLNGSRGYKYGFKQYIVRRLRELVADGLLNQAWLDGVTLQVRRRRIDALLTWLRRRSLRRQAGQIFPPVPLRENAEPDV